MMRSNHRGNWILAGLLLAVLALAVGAQPDLTRPNIEYLPAMRRAPSYEAYEPNPVLPGGTTMQLPPEGTIRRGATVLHYRATTEDAIRAGKELANPVPPDSKAHAASVTRGRGVFQINCVPCHGPGGNADGPVVKHGYPPPPSLINGKSTKMQDGQLFHILTYGQGNMSSFAGQLAPVERWDVINFIRSLQRAAAERSAPSGKSSAPSKPAEPSASIPSSKDSPSPKEPQP